MVKETTKKEIDKRHIFMTWHMTLSAYPLTHNIYIESLAIRTRILYFFLVLSLKVQRILKLHLDYE